MKKVCQKLSDRLLSFLAWVLVSLIGYTCRLRVVGYEHVQELLDAGRGFIMAVWHGRTLLPVYYCRGMGIWAIVSPSRDGNLQAEIISRFGYRIIEGSSTRGGIRAGLSACRKLQEGEILAITPDGPRGPAREIQEGMIFLAQRAQCPIVPIGAGARPRKLMHSWDNYAFPIPFSKCAIVFGKPIEVGHSEDTDIGLPNLLKEALDSVQRQAELLVGENS